MDFDLTEEQIAIRELARDFANQELAPHAATWDEQAIFPIEQLKAAAKLGLAAITTDPSLGGSGLTRLDSAIIFTELAKACVSTAAYLSIHNMVNSLISTYASDELRQTWCPALSSMERLASYCLTEPNSGSDAAALKTTAIKQGEDYVINGSKCFISGGGASDVYACIVRTSDAGAKGISCILVEKDTPGLSFGKTEKKLGWNSQPTTMLFFEDCKVPARHLVGEEGRGFNLALNALNGGRINIAACSLGGASFCLQQSLNYVKEREQFNQAIADFQSVQFRLADMATELEAARLMTYRAAVALDKEDSRAPSFCAMAKRFATDIGFSICDQALQLHGGYGYLKSYPIERYFRDLRVHRILEGTNEIMRVIIARQLLNEMLALD